MPSLSSNFPRPRLSSTQNPQILRLLYPELFFGANNALPDIWFNRRNMQPSAMQPGNNAPRRMRIAAEAPRMQPNLPIPAVEVVVRPENLRLDEAQELHIRQHFINLWSWIELIADVNDNRGNRHFDRVNEDEPER